MKVEQIHDIHQKLLNLYNTEIEPLIVQYFNKANKQTEKSSAGYATTLVTEADIAINDMLTKKLPELLPTSTVISEESEQVEQSTYMFIIDPIDGTHALPEI